jgi:hypothetical protein
VVSLDPAEVVATAQDGLIAGEAEILADEEPARSRPNSPSRRRAATPISSSDLAIRPPRGSRNGQYCPLCGLVGGGDPVLMAGSGGVDVGDVLFGPAPYGEERDEEGAS